MGHRRFLPIKHPLRRHAHYDGKADHRTKPRHRASDQAPYWEVLDVRHAIDVMHLTNKSLCEPSRFPWCLR